MGFKSLLLFILGVFAVFIAYSINTNTPLDSIDVYQTVSVNNPSWFDIEYRHASNKPYMLVTSSDKNQEPYVSYQPRFRVVDYGTYHEIDSLKCLRLKQMKWDIYHLEKLNKKSCD